MLNGCDVDAGEPLIHILAVLFRFPRCSKPNAFTARSGRRVRVHLPGYAPATGSNGTRYDQQKDSHKDVALQKPHDSCNCWDQCDEKKQRHTLSFTSSALRSTFLTPSTPAAPRTASASCHHSPLVKPSVIADCTNTYPANNPARTALVYFA
jgi:hypothetical protein